MSTKRGDRDAAITASYTCTSGEYERRLLHRYAKMCKVKIKTEVLDEIENFSANDELDVELNVKLDVKLDVEIPDVPKKDSKQKDPDAKDSKGKGFVISSCKPETVTTDEYVDFEEYIQTLTSGKRPFCSVCRIDRVPRRGGVQDAHGGAQPRQAFPVRLL